MRTFTFLFMYFAGFFVAGTASAQASADAITLEKWRGYTGVTWNQSADKGAILTRFAGSVTAPIAGLHFDRNGTAYVSTPRVLSPDAPATLSILDLKSTSGPARLTAFPTLAGNATRGPAGGSLRNVLGFHVDQHNGWLWALDMGFIAGESEAPVGAQKVMIFKLDSGALVKSISLDSVADRKGSFLNDIVVDERRKIAYVSDSGFRSAPDNMTGIIVIDFKSGKSRRVLHRHPSVQIEPGVKVHSHGEEVWPNKPLLIGINGIALSPDARILYWTVTAGTKVHSLPTHILRNMDSTSEKIVSAVRDLGTIGGNTDGIATDRSGMLYITDVTHNGIASFDPKTLKVKLVASDERVHWPDTLSAGPENSLYFTSSNLNNHFGGAIKEGQENYEIWRMPLPGLSNSRK
jgi:sugar lactone lactonase YvrE